MYFIFVNTGLTVSQPGFNRKIEILIIVMPTLVVLMGLSVAVYAFSMKKKRSYIKGRGKENIKQFTMPYWNCFFQKNVKQKEK